MAEFRDMLIFTKVSDLGMKIFHKAYLQLIVCQFVLIKTVEK